MSLTATETAHTAAAQRYAAAPSAANSRLLQAAFRAYAEAQGAQDPLYASAAPVPAYRAAKAA